MTSLLNSETRSEPPLLAVPLVCCVVVNWNGWQDTIECLRSLALQDYPNLTVLVIDNASTNDSVPRIHQACPEVEIVETGANLGFSGGCNTGIRKALALGADFVWLLNNDTIAPPDTLTRLVAAAHPRAGITGTVLYYAHKPGKVQAWGGGRIFPWFGYVAHFTAPAAFGPKTFLTFASVLIRREVFADIGLLDECYFMYFEDSDFCFRSRTADWQLAIAADTAVLHKEGGSADRTRSGRMQRIVTTSGLHFLRRHAVAPPISMTLFVMSRISKRLVFADLSGVRAVVLGVSDWWQKRFTVFQGGL